MEDEIEDLVGDVRYTDSQKSGTTSNAYSPDFTDTSSDKNHSSGKDTYVIDWDESDDSDQTFQIHHNPSIINLTNQIEDKTKSENQNLACGQVNTISRSIGTSLHKCAVSQEIYTQTSRTIFELVANENQSQFVQPSRTLQTQTSVLSVTENRTIEYKIEVKEISKHFQQENKNDCTEQTSNCNDIKYNRNPNNFLDDCSTKYPDTETQNEITEDADSDSTFSDRIIQFIDAESCENIPKKELDQTSYSTDSSKIDSDIEEDSLMVNEYRQDKTANIDSISDTSVPKSVDNDVEELYNKISESIDFFVPEKPNESDLRRFGTLTPLSEETTPMKDNIIDMTPSIKCITKSGDDAKKSSSISNPSIRHAMSADNTTSQVKDQCKLPPIHKNKSSPNSPNLNFLFSNIPSNKGQNSVERTETLLDRWDFCTNTLAGGESPQIIGRSDPARSTNVSLHLPPIHVEGVIRSTNTSVNYITTHLNTTSKDSSSVQESICIQDKIKQLKITERKSRVARSRGGSPTSTASPDEGRACDVAERGSEALCAELLRKLRSALWTEVADTLQELPRFLDRFWSALSENRIADLLRQVTVHVDSPRTQVARLACNTIAEILKNTHYVKKPDFFEAVTTLLMKTGSLNRPVRRAANVALDDIVSSVELSHAVTALCVHGVGHKSALVRCASARLLVVCCALAGGGRGLLRGRPPSAAAARRHALHALAVLLDDKNIETRKYAERLYLMLRPLASFEAYFLTDVDVERAAGLMRRLDRTARTTR